MQINSINTRINNRKRNAASLSLSLATLGKMHKIQRVDSIDEPTAARQKVGKPKQVFVPPAKRICQRPNNM